MKIIKPFIVIPKGELDSVKVQNIERYGRICYKSEDLITPDSAEKFVKGIIKSGHESVIEHEKAAVIITSDRGVTHEIVRHRVGSYSQESTRYCVAGDMVLTTKNQHHKLTVKDLYENRIKSRNSSWRRINIKQLNENTGELTYAPIEDIFYTGTKPVYEIKTKLGYTLKSTLEHEIFTDNGYKKLDELNLGDRVAVNGVSANAPDLKNKDWLFYQYNVLEKTTPAIASEFGFKVSTVKKWVRKLELPVKEKSYWNRGRTPWNKGLREDNDIRVKVQADALREHHWNEGRIGVDRKDRIKKFSESTYHKYVGSKCEICESVKTLQVHHINENRNDNREDNLITLCSSCHGRVHAKNLNFVHFDVIASIRYIGNEDVFDISMRSEFRNFVANGVIVHNCNYSKEKFGQEITVIEPYFYDNSVLYRDWYDACVSTEAYYMSRLEPGSTPQEARSILPNSLKTEIVVTFNMREWRHFFKLRCSAKAHPQMRQVAIPLLLKFQECLPALFADVDYDRSFPVEHYAEIREVS